MASSAPHAAPPPGHGHVWQFGECEFDELRYELRVGGIVTEIEAKPLEVLHQLLRRAPEVVRKEELLETVWPGVLVVDASLATAVSKLRKALGDESLIKTVPRIGYRLSVPVRCLTAEDARLSPEVESSASSTKLDLRASLGKSTGGFQTALGRRFMVGAIAALVVVALLIGLASFRTLTRTNPIPRAVAILPFQNVDANRDLEYLRSALPDQIANSLSMARSLTIRPVPAIGPYANPALDLRKAARELDVDRIVTGHYVLAGDQLQITMEAVDTDEDRVLWRETFNVPANDLLQLQAQVAAISKGSLARSLGITQFVSEMSPPPANEKAYELYLRSLAINWDPTPDREAIELLRKSVMLDPSFGPAWGQLSLRYYGVSRFGGGGPEMLQMSDAAAEQQMALDPDSPGPVAELTIHRTERGDLVEAHQQALELVRRRPDNPNNHHVLSYVLRYGGSLEEAGRQCDLVILLASKFVWGSCSTTFMQLGDYQKARSLLRKDLSSEWSKAHAIEIYMREGKLDQAIRIGPPKIPHWDSYKMLLACAAHEPESQIRALAAGVEVDDDPEVDYFFAGHLAYCRQTDAALRMLKLAIDRNYCSCPTMDKDPMFDSIRSDPEFMKVREAGIACHENFVANHLPPPTQDVPVANASHP